MLHDRKLFTLLLALLLIPLSLAFFGNERFRYPCQDPENWDKAICKVPVCEVTRSCPEHIFKGQRDPRLGPPKQETHAPTAVTCPSPVQGVTNGK